MNNEVKIKRLSEIQDQIAALAKEGMAIANECQVIFQLGHAPFAENYGSGGLKYYPEGDGPYMKDDYELTDMGGESVRGQWMSSNSWGC